MQDLFEETQSPKRNNTSLPSQIHPFLKSRLSFPCARKPALSHPIPASRDLPGTLLIKFHCQDGCSEHAPSSSLLLQYVFYFFQFVSKLLVTCEFYQQVYILIHRENQLIMWLSIIQDPYTALDKGNTKTDGSLDCFFQHYSFFTQ